MRSSLVFYYFGFIEIEIEKEIGIGNVNIVVDDINFVFYLVRIK